MNDATLIALSKLSAKEAKNAALSVGRHAVRETVTVEIDAIVSKFADEFATPTHKVCKLNVLAHCLRYMGATREAALSNLMDAIKRSIEEDEKSADHIRNVTDIADTEKSVVDALAELPKVKKSGKTTVKGEVKIV